MKREYKVTMVTGKGSVYAQIVTARNKAEALAIAKPLPFYMSYDAWASGKCYAKGKTFIDRIGKGG